MSCLFCDIIDGKKPANVIYRDEMILAFQDINPQAKVHFLVVPLKHIENLSALQKEDADLMAHMMLTLPKIAFQQGLQNGFKTITHTGSGGGQEIYHMHFHILGGR